MNGLSSLSISILFLLITLMTFILIPFYKKNIKKYFALGLLIFSLIMFFVPESLIGKFPFIGGNVEKFIHDFLNSTKQFKDINGLSPSIESNLIYLIEKTIKMCVIFIVDGLVILLSSILFFIVHIVKKKKNYAGLTFSTILTVMLCFVMILAPLYSIFNINKKMNENLASDGALYKSYPEYEKYKEIFDFLNKGSSMINEKNEKILDNTYYLTYFFSNGADRRIVDDLSSVKPLLNQLKDSGLTIIYTDKDFDFSETTETTFDFDEMNSLIANVLKTEIFNDVARGFANQILALFEEQLKVDSETTDDIMLTLSPEEFRKQYKGIVKMLKFVVDYDLADRVQNMNISTLLSIIKDLKVDGLITLLTEIVRYPLVQKIKQYMDQKYGLNPTGLDAAIYACVRLYDVLNTWLKEYRTTSLYNTSEEFLRLGGII